MHIHCPRLHVRLGAPYSLEKVLTPLSQAAAVYHKKKQPVLCRRKSHVHSPDTDPMPGPVDDDRADRVRLARDSRSTRSPQNRPDSQNQLIRVERLCEVIICAKRQSLDAVGVLTQGGEHQECAVPCAGISAEGSHNVKSRHVGKHEIEQDEGNAAHSALFNRFLTGKGCNGLITSGRKMVSGELDDVRLVVDDENAVSAGRYRLHSEHSVTVTNLTVNHFVASRLLHSCCDCECLTVAGPNRER